MPNSGPPIRVLLIEDNPGDVRLIAESLRSAPTAFELRTVDRLAEVRPALASAPADVLLLDLGLPDAQGLESFNALRTIAPGIPIIVLSGLSDEDIAVRAVREGAQDYLVKGRFDGDTLPRVVRFAVERRRADEALRRSEARFHAAIEASPDAFAVLEAVRDASGRIWSFTITDLNSRAEKLLGGTLSTLAGKPLEEWCPFGPAAESVPTFSRVVETREFVEQEIPIETPSPGWILRQVYPIGDGVAVFVRDITDRKRSQDQLRQTQKMEALGQLAAGIAHDFRNLSSAMQGHIAQARAQLPPDHAALASLDQIQSAASQASAITGSLLRYSAKTIAEKKPVRLAAILEQSVGILGASLPASINVQTSISDPFIFIHADPSQIQQVIMNLALNARDAMPQGGTLSLAIDLVPSSDHASPGLARLTVRDTGLGMSPETLSHIFEPYFTTKPRGQGTGLGLSIIHGIITEHGGAIAVNSKPGAGSTFTVTLPAIPAPALTGQDTPRLAPARQTALLIEPNRFSREVVASMLASLNFEVLQAADAAAATRLATAANRNIDLVIAASQLPDSTGAAAIQSLRQSTSAKRAILISATPPHNGEARHDPQTGLLLHPFRRADLVKEIERLRA